MKKLSFILFFTLFTQCTLHSQWTQQTVPVNKPITGIKFIDSLRGWACTSIGTGGANYAYVLHTTNGGTNWFLQDSTFNGTLSAICVIDSNIIYAGGYDFTTNSANLNKTANGGINWTVIPTPTNMAIGDMVFLNQDSGWICSINIGPDVRTTTNGGVNWTVRASGIAAQTQRIFFLNYTTGFCAANFSLYKTTNAGVSWGLLHSFSQQVQCAYFLNENTGWVGLPPDTTDKIAYTTNGGVSWLMQNIGSPYLFNIIDIFFTSSETGYACTGFNKICKTTNSGFLWGYQYDASLSHKLTFIDSSHGWTCNNGISHTANGGGQIFYTGFTSQGTEIPRQFTLYQNYPNPFNPYTTIRLDVAQKSVVNLVICDVLGREKYTITNQVLDAGEYTFNWDSRDYASGVYFYRLISDRYTETKKMILLK